MSAANVSAGMSGNGAAPAASQQGNHNGHGGLEAYHPRLLCLPLKCTKVVHFIRHGEGTHNVAGHKDVQAYKSFDYEDAHLTELGWQQARALGLHIRATKLSVDLVVTSPLQRTLETTTGAFGLQPWMGAAQHGEPLMMEQAAVESKCCASDAVSAYGCPPIIAHELCREHLGVHPCDKRRATSHYKRCFPAVDFSLVTEEHDVLWQLEYRETKEEIAARGLAFIRWLMTRPERSIAVVTHSSLLHFMLQNFAHAHHESTSVQADLIRWFENCEMRSFVLADEGALPSSHGGAPLHDPLHFPGGAACVLGAQRHK